MESKSEIEAIDILTDAALRRTHAIGINVYHKCRDPHIRREALQMQNCLDYSVYRFFGKVDRETKMIILDDLEIGDFYDVINQYISFCNESSPDDLYEAGVIAEKVREIHENVRWLYFWVWSTEKVKQEVLDYIVNSNNPNRIKTNIKIIVKKKGEELGLLLNKSDMLHNQMNQILLKEGLTTPDLSLLSPDDKAKWNALYEQSKEVSEGICKLVNDTDA